MRWPSPPLPPVTSATAPLSSISSLLGCAIRRRRGIRPWPDGGCGSGWPSRSVRDAQQGRLLKRLADELDRDRQSAFAKPGADRDRRIAGDVERHHKARPLEYIPFRHGVDLWRLGGLGCGQDDIEPRHRLLQFGAQFAPASQRLDIIDPRDKGAQHQPAAHPLAEIAKPGARPFLIGGGALDDRDQRAAGRPILQRRQLHLADFGAETAERLDRAVDAALGRRR